MKVSSVSVVSVFGLSSICSGWSAPRANEAASPFMVFPKEIASKADLSSFTQTLSTLLGADNVFNITDTSTGRLRLWTVNLSPTQVTKVKEDPVVKSVVKDGIIEPTWGNIATKRSLDSGGAALGSRAFKDKLVTIQNAPYELRQLSTGPEEALNPAYVYDEAAGQGVTVYVLDDGFFLDHQDFVETEKRMINITRPNIDEDRSMGNEHGTCAASKAVGGIVGVARAASLVAVRMTSRHLTIMLEAWGEVIQDIGKYNLQGKAVVSTSIAAELGSVSKAWTDILKEYIRELLDLDVPVVVSAGNLGTKVPISCYPQIWAPRIPIILVGSVGREGTLSTFSQGGTDATTFAGGESITCADIARADSYVECSGTSYSAPLVAGLIAYYMSLPDWADKWGLKFDASNPGQVVRHVQKVIQTMQFPRVKGGPNIAWNGKGASCEWEPSTTAGRLRRRASLPACRHIAWDRNSTTTTGSAAATRPTKPPARSCTAYCGAQPSNGILGGQVGCKDATVAQKACDDNGECLSYSFGLEDRGTYSTNVCNIYTVDAGTASGNPVTGSGCTFTYYTKGCSPG